MIKGTVKHKMMVLFLLFGFISVCGGAHASVSTRSGSTDTKSPQDIIETTAATLLEQLRT